MNEAIKLAILEGGYEPVGCDLRDMEQDHIGILDPKIDDRVKEAEGYDYCIYHLEYPEEGYFYAGTFNNAILDPLFWQALGKALEKDKHDFMMAKSKSMEMEYCCQCHIDKKFLTNQPECKAVNETMHNKAVAYLNLVLLKGDTEKFWKELLK